MNYFDFNFSQLSVIVVTQVITGMLMVTLGLIVFFHNTSSQLNRSFLLMTIPEFIWFAGFALAQLSQTLGQAWFWLSISYIGICNIPIGGYYFSIRYVKKYDQQKYLLFLGMAIMLFWIILGFLLYPDFFSVKLYEWGYYTKAGPLYYIFLIPFFFYLALIAVNIIILHRETKVYLEKQVSLILLAAFIVADFGAIDFIPAFVDVPFLKPIGYIPIAVWIGLVGYTLLKYRIWDVKFIAHKTFYYFSFSIFILFTYTLFFSLFLSLINQEIDLNILLFNGLIFLILSFAWGFLKDRTQTFVNQIFYRQKINYKASIESLNEKITKLIDLETLLQTIFTALKQNLLINNVTVLTYQEDERPLFKPLKTTVKKKDIQLPILWELNSNFFNHLNQRPLGITLDELYSYPQFIEIKTKAKRLFDLYKAELALPVSRRKRLMAILFLGQRMNRKLYDPEIRQSLASFSRVLSVALENAKLYQEVKTVSQLKSDIISIVSHQLRTPITNLRWGLDLLMRGAYGKLSAGQQDIAKQLHIKTVESSEMINRLLNISHFEHGQFVHKPEPLNLITLVKKTIVDFRPVIKSKKIKIILDCSEDSLTIQADPERLREILEILLDNAYKYSLNSTEIMVKIRQTSFVKPISYYKETSQTIQGVKISVIDQGLGILPEDKPKLFTKFFRGKNVTQVETSGLGIGLAYAKSLIDLHKGKIEIKSKLNQGTQVDVYLPLSMRRRYEGQTTVKYSGQEG